MENITQNHMYVPQWPASMDRAKPRKLGEVEKQKNGKWVMKVGLLNP